MTDKVIMGKGFESAGCHKCLHSKMNGMDLVCVEWQQVIEDDECFCSCYEEEES